MKLKPLVIAMGAAMPLAAMAATISAPSNNTYSKEFLETNAIVTPGTVALTLGAQYAEQDIVQINYSKTPRAAASTGTFSFATADLGAGAGNLDIVVTGTNGKLSFVDQTDTTVRYRVVTAPSATGGEITLPQPRFLSAEIGLSDLEISSSSVLAGSGSTFDVSKPADLVKVTGSQFGYTISGLSKTIDVESARKAFAVTGGTASSHVISILVDDDVLSASNAATAGTIAVTLTGDFSWIDANTSTSATGIQTTGSVSGNFAVQGVSATAITLATAAAANAGTYTIGLSNPSKLAIPTQTINLSLTQAYGSTTAFATASAAGSYKLNGSAITVYAVPMSSTVDRLLWLTNSGKTSGDVSIIVNDNGKEIDLGVVGTSKAGAEFDLSTALDDALAAKGATLSGGRVHLDVVTNVPASEVVISAVYRSGGDRVNLLTSSEIN